MDFPEAATDANQAVAWLDYGGARTDKQAAPVMPCLTILVTMVIMVVIFLWAQTMQTIKASEFKAKCLALMDEVARTGETIRITKNGKPVAELRPVKPAKPVSPFGMWKGHTRALGDIISPAVDPDDWEALK